MTHYEIPDKADEGRAVRRNCCSGFSGIISGAVVAVGIVEKMAESEMMSPAMERPGLMAGALRNLHVVSADIWLLRPPSVSG